MAHITEPNTEEHTWIEWTEHGYVQYETHPPRTDNELAEWLDTQPTNPLIAWGCALSFWILGIGLVAVSLLFIS